MNRAAVILLLALGLTGCTILPKVKLPGVGTATAFKDAGTPATIAEGTERSSIRLPEDSKVRIIRTEAVPTTGIITPATTMFEFELTRPSEFLTEARRIQASTGTVDTTVAVRRADNQARMPLLYAAIGAIVAAGIAFWLKFPTPALLCAAASGVFLLAWGAAGLPPWFWMLGVAALAVGAGIYFGFNRGEKPDPTDK